MPIWSNTHCHTSWRWSKKTILMLCLAVKTNASITTHFSSLGWKVKNQRPGDQNNTPRKLTACPWKMDGWKTFLVSFWVSAPFLGGELLGVRSVPQRQFQVLASASFSKSAATDSELISGCMYLCGISCIDTECNKATDMSWGAVMLKDNHQEPQGKIHSMNGSWAFPIKEAFKGFFHILSEVARRSFKPTNLLLSNIQHYQ